MKTIRTATRPPEAAASPDRITAIAPMRWTQTDVAGLTAPHRAPDTTPDTLLSTLRGRHPTPAGGRARNLVTTAWTHRTKRSLSNAIHLRDTSHLHNRLLLVTPFKPFLRDPVV
jgi:hypothetical protein